MRANSDQDPKRLIPMGLGAFCSAGRSVFELTTHPGSAPCRTANRINPESAAGLMLEACCPCDHHHLLMISKPNGATADCIRPMRLYGILDTAYVEDAQWESRCEALLQAGVDMIELRAKDCPVEKCLELTARIVPLFSSHLEIPLIINDHLEVALGHPRLGLHLGQDDMDPRQARETMGPSHIIGLSTHSLEQACAAEALGPEVLSYFCIGPVFATPTKPEYREVGLGLVRQVARELKPTLPFFAIGGIKSHNLHQVIAAGAERVCIVSELLQSDDPRALAHQVKAAFNDPRP